MALMLFLVLVMARTSAKDFNKKRKANAKEGSQQLGCEYDCDNPDAL